MKMVVKRTSPESWMVSPAKAGMEGEEEEGEEEEETAVQHRSHASISAPLSLNQQSTPTKSTGMFCHVDGYYVPSRGTDFKNSDNFYIFCDLSIGKSSRSMC